MMAMITPERDLEESLVTKLRDLKYEYRPDIRDRAKLEANFREKFEPLNRVNLTDGEFQRLLDEALPRRRLLLPTIALDEGVPAQRRPELTKHLRHTGGGTGKARQNPNNPNQNPDSLRRGASQAAGAAPTLRYGPTGDSAPRLRLKAAGMTERFPFGPSARPDPPLFPREQYVSPDRPAAVQGAKRRSEPLTARTDLESSRARGKGVGCRRGWTNGL